MSFSYYDKDNNIKRLNIEVGKEWSSYKGKDENSLVNSIFNAVDTNSDGKVDKEEFDIFQKLLKIADSQIEETKNNNIIEEDELKLLVDKFKEYDLTDLKGNELPQIPKIINIPDDIEKLKNIDYTFVDTFYDDEHNKKYIDKVTKIYNLSVLKNLENGKYYIDHYTEEWNKEGIIVKVPVVVRMQESNQDETLNWSEGINRDMKKIQLRKANCSNELIEFMNKVAEEQGFKIELLDGEGLYGWIEDYGVVRFDKKQVIPNCKQSGFHMEMLINNKRIIANRAHVTVQQQGSASSQPDGQSNPNAIGYSHVVSPEDIVEGKTYLEGGNVLNTLTQNGEPGAIIGEESIGYTMLAMGLDISEESIKTAKKQIAEELGLKEDNVTYIPQYDFHIDMHYRPLNDGQIAVPDYKAGINILKEQIGNLDIKIKSMDAESELASSLEEKKQTYVKLTNRLEIIRQRTNDISIEAENELKEKGYEIVKIPCFADIPKTNYDKIENPINYMNGICGTSAKTGDKFYITNTSGDETLDAYMENYFKEVAGFDKVYFAPTKEYLESSGGIDCLTKEF